MEQRHGGISPVKQATATTGKQRADFRLAP